MKKLYLLILTCLFFIIFPSGKVSAASFAISADSLSAISGGLEDMTYGAYVPYQVIPLNKSDALEALAIERGVQLSNVVTYNDFDTITTFDRMPYDVLDIVNNWEFCNSDGTLIYYPEDLYYGHFDNGYYSGHVIFDSDGDIVYRYSDGDIYNRVCNLEFGGAKMSTSEFNNAFTNTSLSARKNGFAFTSDGTVDGFDTTFYYWYGYASLSGVKTESLYIANQYQPGYIMALNYQGWQGYICQWYANDLSYFTHTLTGNIGSDYYVSEGDYVSEGIHYRYYVRFAEGLTLSSLTDYDTWINDPHGVACFSTVGRQYTTDFINSGAIAFAPASTLVDDDVITVERPYGLDQVNDYVDSFSGSLDRDVAFDPSLPLSDTNYPIAHTIDVAIDDSLPIPFPDAIEEEKDIVIDYPFEGVITIPEGGFEIPIISDLQTRFPFSIPWDIKNLLKGLRAVREAPHFEISWYIRPIDYTWEFSLDLSDFENVAAIFRNCFLILFILGLCKFSYEHFFGA